MRRRSKHRRKVVRFSSRTGDYASKYRGYLLRYGSGMDVRPPDPPKNISGRRGAVVRRAVMKTLSPEQKDLVMTRYWGKR